MNERPKSAGLLMPLLAAASVLAVAFGGGVLFGWATRERKAEAPETSAASASDPQEVKRELKACRREWAELSRPRVIATAVPMAGDANDAGPESAAKVEVLEKEVQECRVRETLVKAYVCSNIVHHQNMLATFINNDECVDNAGIGDFIVSSFDKCAEFEDFPAHLNEDDLTKLESNAVAAAESNRRILRKEKLVDSVRGSHSRCREYLGLPDE